MDTMTDNETHCIDCGKKFVPKGLGSGYAIMRKGDKDVRVCYDCCAIHDAQIMDSHGKMVLYLVAKREESHGHSLTTYEVTNWPGTLVFPALSVKKGRHNIAGSRTDVWFQDSHGKEWHGVQYGDFTQIIHCKRTKEKW